MVAAASLTAACGGSGDASDPGSSQPNSGDASGPGASQPNSGDASGPGSNQPIGAAPVWAPIPDQVWTVGVPVTLDLSQYCTDPDGDPLVFTLDQLLPPGLTINGSVISGTPTAAFDTRPFVATADDGKA